MEKFKNISNRNFVIEILAWMGNNKPKQEHINFMESFLMEIPVQHKLIFDRRLSEREISCLRLAAQGYSIDEIADFLNIKPTTVITFRKNIFRKLKCKTMPQAVFKGMWHSYLSPEIEINS